MVLIFIPLAKLLDRVLGSTYWILVTERALALNTHPQFAVQYPTLVKLTEAHTEERLRYKIDAMNPL